MNKKQAIFCYTIGLLFSFSQVFATEITDLTVIPNGSQLTIDWSALSQEIMDNTNGYAIQWSTEQNDVRIDKFAQQFSSQNSLTLRKASFEINKDYYFRVYSYVLDGRNRVLGNGSKILKWQMDFQDNIETSQIEPNDPVISTVVSTTSSEDEVLATFGALRISKFDTFVDFAWSKPSNLTSNDYDGFAFEVSKHSDLKDPIIEFKVNKTRFRTRLKGLEPNTQYHARGYFYKDRGGEAQLFGGEEIKAFKTIIAIDRDGRTRSSRNIKRIEKYAYFAVSVDGNETSETPTINTTTSLTTTTRNTTVTTPTTMTDIRKRIVTLKAEIKILQKELRTLLKKLRDMYKNN
ncbi:hypothetical protein KAI58_03610 [Candidatus Gracilibacteria bacterium]|nr:hypothetical protein [Candidatus Gracilibacteria bacterium]